MIQEYSELDKQLQEIARADWKKFVRLVGETAIDQAKSCLLRKNNLSLQQIANKVHITKRKAQQLCSYCPED